ncbi:MAG: hypothetical protein ACTII7_13490 [Galactobacter sp.]
MRPEPWKHAKDVPTIWVDYTTGKGVYSNGEAVIPKIGPRRKNPNLVDMLDTAAHYGAGRIMFTGKVPLAEQGQRHWLAVQTPGWDNLGNWLNAPVTGRFERRETGQYVEVRTVSEWFGSVPLNPSQARDAWDATKAMIGATFDGAPIMKSPAGTGTNLWAMSMPKNLDPEPVTSDIAAELHATDAQHHIEHLVAGPSRGDHPDLVPLIDPVKTPKLNAFAYADGRFMYAAMCRELGTGPGQRLRGPETADLLRENPYARARVLIKFTVPDTWDHVGIFGVAHESVNHGWYYPNRPGATGVTWADSVEISVAQKYGWLIEPLESIVFNQKAPSRDGSKLVSARPLDTFAQRITRAREWVEADEIMSESVREAVSSALRTILLQTIGGFASRGRGMTVVKDNPQDIPPEFQAHARRQGKLWVYKVPSKLQGRQLAFYRPELAVQVWARARARVLSGPTGMPGMSSGALHVNPHTLIGIQGDAIYTSELPEWALPIEDAGGDDGKTGRLRLKGYLPGPVKTPETRDARNRLRQRSERAGIDAAYNDLELITPTGDDADYLVTDELWEE